MYWSDFYSDDYCGSNIVAKEPSFSMSILPTVTTSQKIKRAVNRLLPKGRRHRGDVCAV